MQNFHYDLTVETPYGPTIFALTIGAGGRVTGLGLPLHGLPLSVYKLTYGAEWQAVKDYFAALAETLRYRIEPSLRVGTYPAELNELVAGFKTTFGTEPDDVLTQFWNERQEWMGLFTFGESKLNRRLKKFIAVGPHPDFTPYLLAYFQSLFPVASERTEALLWRAIGSLATEEAREYLLEALESEGRHPFTGAILRGLDQFTDPGTLTRLAEVYRSDKFGPQELEDYLLGLHRFADAAGHVTEILRKNSEQVATVVTALRAAGLPELEVGRELFAQFEREEDYYAIDPILLAINGVDTPTYRVDLWAMNEKVDKPVYLDLPPVNWPQQLERGWREIVERTTHEEMMRVVAGYLERPEPRLQRNAIMQLKHYRQLPGRTEATPPAIEKRMRQLLSSPFDKVYVEILNVLGAGPLDLADREGMFRALLEVSLRSPYRTVVLKAIYRVGKAAEWRAYARAYYLSEAAGDQSGRRIEQIAAALPYLEKYLGDTAAIREVAAR